MHRKQLQTLADALFGRLQGTVCINFHVELLPVLQIDAAHRRNVWPQNTATQLFG